MVPSPEGSPSDLQVRPARPKRPGLHGGAGVTSLHPCALARPEVLQHTCLPDGLGASHAIQHLVNMKIIMMHGKLPKDYMTKMKVSF